MNANEAKQLAQQQIPNFLIELIRVASINGQNELRIARCCAEQFKEQLEVLDYVITYCDFNLDGFAETMVINW